MVTYEQSVSDYTIGGEDADPEACTSKEVPKMLSFTKDITVEQSQGGVKNSNGLDWNGWVELVVLVQPVIASAFKTPEQQRRSLLS